VLDTFPIAAMVASELLVGMGMVTAGVLGLYASAQMLLDGRVVRGLLGLLVGTPVLAEDAPKTAASRRTVKLLPNVVELLKSTQMLNQTPDDYVYTDEQGTPIDQSEFARSFQGVLRVLSIRPRPFYNTRHTYISVALTTGCNIKWIAEQCGTSVQMIQDNYGKYIRSDGDAPMLAYLSQSKGNKEDLVNEESETFGETFSDDDAKLAGMLASPTGFELETIKTDDDTEQSDVIDISKLKKIGE
jgi:hypothetical protein